jgi:hypothetical protein
MRRPTRARPAFQTLERLHAELGGKILENKQEHENLAGQMRHVEAVIKMLDPSYSLPAISVKRRATGKWFKRGTLYRKALDVLRTAEQPMTATDLAWAVLAANNITTGDKKAVQILGQRIQASLRNHAGKGIQQVNDGSPVRWRLKEAAN